MTATTFFSVWISRKASLDFWWKALLTKFFCNLYRAHGQCQNNATNTLQSGPLQSTDLIMSVFIHVNQQTKRKNIRQDLTTTNIVENKQNKGKQTPHLAILGHIFAIFWSQIYANIKRTWYSFHYVNSKRLIYAWFSSLTFPLIRPLILI